MILSLISYIWILFFYFRNFLPTKVVENQKNIWHSFRHWNCIQCSFHYIKSNIFIIFLSYQKPFNFSASIAFRVTVLLSTQDDSHWGIDIVPHISDSISIAVVDSKLYFLINKSLLILSSSIEECCIMCRTFNGKITSQKAHICLLNHPNISDQYIIKKQSNTLHSVL